MADGAAPVCGHLAVVTHVVHHRWQGRLHAYTPYARELDAWASMVDRLTVVAPVRDGEPPADTSPLDATNVAVAPQIEAGGDDRRAKLAQLRRLPAMVVGVDRAIRGADAVQVRCPGNLGLIGAVVAPMRSRRVMAKYAGQWRGFPGEPRAWRWQRAVLGSRWFRGPVLAYGPAPTDRPHVIPAFSTAIDDAALTRAGAAVSRRWSTARGAGLSVLFVGRLTAAKRVDAVIAAVGLAAARGVDVSLRVVGDGPERVRLERAVADLPVPAAASVAFVGAVDQAEVLAEYERADVLVLASESEGWPKAIVEAMAFGVVCIGNDGGMVPVILDEGRGSTVAPGDAAAIAGELVALAGDRHLLEARSRAAAAWASRFSIEAFEAEMRGVLAVAWRDGGDVLRPPRLRGAVTVTAPTRPGRPDLDEPARVLQVIDSLAVGGAEQMAVHLANELVRWGHESSLVATRAGGPLADALDGDVWWRSLDRRGRFDRSAPAALRAIVRERRIDVVHAHSTSIFLVAAAFAGRSRPAVVWHDHLGAAAERNPWPLRAVSWSIDRAVAASAGIEAADRDHLRLGDRLVRIPNFSVLDPAELDRPTATTLDLPGRPGARLVCVANLRPPKDQLMLVRAMAEVVERHPDAHLLLVGADVGDYAAEVAAAVEERGLGRSVSRLGQRIDVAALLRACDIGVLGSRAEGTPLSVIEYGLAGLPVVATDVGEVAELLDGAGRLVPAGDAAAMARALIDLLAAPDERDRLGGLLRARIGDRYSADAGRGAWEALYREARLRRRASSDRR